MTRISVPVAPGWYIVRKDGSVFHAKTFATKEDAEKIVRKFSADLKVVRRGGRQ